MEDTLKLIRIQAPNHPSLPALLRLYTNTFPLEERRETGDLLDRLKDSSMYLMQIFEGNQLSGFVIYRIFDQFIFVEHFALFPQYQGQNIGSRVLQKLKERSLPLLLEAEPPEDGISRRRIAFYQRNGFQALDLPYFQPPYHAGHSPLPMLLLSDKPVLVEEELQLKVSSIHRTVYGVSR